MKILFVLTGLGLGGAEKQVISLSERYTFLNHKVTLICLSEANQLLPQDKDIRIINLNMKKSIVSCIKSILTIRLIVKEINPDIIHSHMFHANIFMRVFCLITGYSKLICTAHSKNEGGRFRMFLYRITDFLCARMTNVSAEAVEEFKNKKVSRKIELVYNGIEVNRFLFSKKLRKDKRSELFINKEDFLFLSIGRLTEAKDYPNLLDSLVKLRNITNKKFKTVIVGEGHLKDFLIDYSIKIGISDSVRFLGSRDDIRELLCACDCFVLSSEWEGFGLVVAEAMACERVVVATDAGGVREVLGDTGQLIPIKDSKMLSNALLNVLESGIKTNRNGKLRVIEKFSLNKIAEQWLEIYSELNEK